MLASLCGSAAYLCQILITELILFQCNVLMTRLVLFLYSQYSTSISTQICYQTELTSFSGSYRQVNDIICQDYGIDLCHPWRTV